MIVIFCKDYLEEMMFKYDLLNNIKGAVFDMDGTLLDSMYLWDKACVDYLLNMGKTPEPGLPLKFKTMSITESAVYYQKHYQITDSVDKITNDINNLLKYSYENTVSEKKGATRILDALKQKNIKMYVATSTDSHLVDIALKSHHMDNYFEGVLTCRQVNASKRFSKVYDVAVDNLRLTKKDVIVFEDSYFAIKTLKENDYKVIAMKDASSKSDADKIISIADIYISSFDELFI
jgi:beta-phosphoglucomutase-like phosphatase (HAD superfamily)